MGMTNAQREYERRVVDLALRLTGNPTLFEKVDLVLVSTLLHLDGQIGGLGLSEAVAMRTIIRLSLFDPQGARRMAADWSAKLG